MKQSKVWVEQLIKALNVQEKKKVGVSNVLDELIYGKNDVQIFQDNKLKPLIIYLNEEIPEILIVVAFPNYDESFINLQDCKLNPQSYKHEIQNQISNYQYIILEQKQQEHILIFPNNNSKQVFLSFFKIYQKELLKNQLSNNSFIFTTFLTMDKNQNMTLNTQEINQLLKKLKLSRNDQFQGIFEYVKNKQGYQTLEVTYRQFQDIMKLLECREEFRYIFEKYINKKVKSYKFYEEKYMSYDGFVKFLMQVQRESQKDAEHIANLYIKKSEKLSFLDFSRYIVNSNNICNKQYQNHRQSQSHPLTSYHCYSSHNTYLTGNQLTSDSKTERYLEDLQSGYRCLEIDIHNGDKGPIVKHGYTITSSITFQDVIKAVSGFSMHNQGHSPIILSLECHANQEQQEQMANIMKKYFNKKILTIPQNCDPQDSYPSLKDCKDKIILKSSGTFNTHQIINGHSLSISSKLQDQELRQSQYQTSSEQQQLDHDQQKIQSTIKGLEQSLDYRKQLNMFKKMKEGLVSQKKIFMKNKKVIEKMIKINFKSRVQEKKKIHPQLIKITTMFSNGSFASPCIWQSISLSQNKIKKFDKKGDSLKQHTNRHWVRAYPSASRINSSNFNPLEALQDGIQIVAINSQCSDINSAILKEFFKKGRNNLIGYRLKNDKENQQIRVKIHPISCSGVTTLKESSSIPNIKIKMKFVGSSKDNIRNHMYQTLQNYTEGIEQNAYNPIFRNSRTMDLVIQNPELAFIIVQIQDCGFGVISLESIKKGYRYLNLLDGKLEQRKSKIIFMIQ